MKRTIFTLLFILILFFYAFSLGEIEKELKIIKFLPEDKVLFSHPASIRVDERNNLYVLDSSLNRIVKLNREGKVIFKIEENFNFRGFKVPLAVDKQGRIYVVDNGNLAVKIFDSKGKLINRFKVPWTSYSMDIDNKGNIYQSIESTDYPSPCKVQCWCEERLGGNFWTIRKCGYAICGYGDNGKPEIWPIF